MVYGAINEKGERFYTDLRKLFGLIGNEQRNYNWLITECRCNIDSKIETEVYDKGYCWINGDDLTSFVCENDIQWIFAVLSGFEKEMPLEKILEFPLPYADGNPDFWKAPITMQHPLATIEIVAWDSSSTLFFSTNKELAEAFRQGYPLSEDLNSVIKKTKA